MNTRKIFIFLLEATISGLAVAFVMILLFRPQALERHPAVRIMEAPAVVSDSQQDAAAGGAPASYAKAVRVATPAVVNIYTSKTITQQRHPLFDDPNFRRFFGGDPNLPRQRNETSLGSGVIISPEGYLLTNNHVIEGADEIQVALNDGRSATARVVGSDPETDLALLKIDLQELPAIVFGQSDSLSVGDVVLAIGNPFGVGQTVTQGIISATGRQQLGISTFENFIQTDAAINPGNSGGALVNTYGQLVGINTAIFSRTGGSQGIGFAIPAQLAKNVMEQILQQGRVIRGWLGIEAQDISPALAESFGLNDTRGALVAGVYPRSAADQAGLMPGDIVLRINGRPVDDAKAAMDIISAFAPGEIIELQIKRNGALKNAKITIGERPQPRAR